MIFLRSSILKRIKQTLVPAAIVNFFSLSQGIAVIHYFPLQVNSGTFLSLLVIFRNTATHRHSEIKWNRSTTKQEFSGEAFSKQNIKASLASLPFDSSWALTEWSAIFAFGVQRCFLQQSCPNGDTQLIKPCIQPYARAPTTTGTSSYSHNFPISLFKSWYF